MSFISSLLHRLPGFHAHKPHATDTPQTGQSLPDGIGQAEAKDWRARLPSAQRLLNRLGRETSTLAASGQRRIPNPANPRQGLVSSSQVTHAAKGSRPVPSPLHANWVSQGAMVMATPGLTAGVDWARACVEHKVRAVVDLSSRKEFARQPAAMGDEREYQDSQGWTSVFERTEGYAERAIDGLPKSCGRLELSAVLAAPPGSDTEEIQRQEQDLSWLQVRTEPGAAIPASTLMAVCEALESLPLKSGETIAFQSPAGDERAAVFAAAHEINGRFNGGHLDAHTLEDVVRDACLRQRELRSPDLFTDPGSIASLLTFAQQLLKRRLPRGTATNAPTVTGQIGLDKTGAPLKSALKGANPGAVQQARGDRRIQFAETAWISDGKTKKTDFGTKRLPKRVR